jgi:microsomal dipeptidase-like Zn-dependent dipeptidase
MPRSFRRKAAYLLIGFVLFLAFMYTLAPPLATRLINRVAASGPYPVAPEARALHERLFVADLHADATLWNRDLLAYGTTGHVDVPRLIAGNIALQAFTAATQVPATISVNATREALDLITPLAFFQRWPAAAWNSAFERARYQAWRVEDAATRSGGKLSLIRYREDLEDYLARRKSDRAITAGILGIEGLHCLEAKLENVGRLYDAGFRMMGIAHFFDNPVGGSAHGMKKYGLTEFGAAVMEEMERRSILVDLAHASPQVIEDVLARATRPVVVSHTGVRATCDSNRNLSDEQLRAIARNGGVIGIGFFSLATCGDDIDHILRAIQHAVAVAGIDHVALGSDWDGAVATPFDASGIGQITEALLGTGMAEADIAKIMGENTLRLLRASLPPRPA